MIPAKLWKVIKATSLLLVLSVSQAWVSAVTPSRIIAKLKTRENKPVKVNGNKTSSGTSIFSGAQIQTPEGVGATVELGPLGRVDMTPKADLTLTFAESGVNVELRSGCAVLTTKVGVKGALISDDGKVLYTDPSKLSTVIGRTASCLGPEAALPIGAAVPALGSSTASVAGAAGSAVVSGATAAKGNGRGADLSSSTPGKP
jgi:hypothetical protein